MVATSARSSTNLAIAIVIAGVLISASLYLVVEAPGKTTTTTTTSTTSTRMATTTGTSSQTACSEIAVNGTVYCSLDVTDDMNFQQFGYSILNAPVTFMGVTFESSCKSNPANCPTQSQGAPQTNGVIPLEVIFPEGGIQYISMSYPPGNYQEEYYLLSAGTPRAGFLLEGAVLAPPLRAILLVEPWQPPTPTAVANSTTDLQLQLFLNSSTSASGFSVSVTVDDYNILDSTNNVTAANDWLVPLGGLDGAPCGNNEAGVVGFAVAAGHYTLSNITAAKFLDLVNPRTTYNCPLYLGYASPTGFLFLPATVTADSYGCNPHVTSECMSGSASTGWAGLTGYYDQAGAFTTFPRGTYTVLGEDQWGDSVLSYFALS